MKHAIALSFFVLSTLLVNSQPYQSLFGNSETYWVFEWANLAGFTQDTIFVEKDTLVEGQSWKKLKASRNNIFGYFAGAIMREDTTTGKVWYKGLHYTDSSLKLAFDFSLNKGDSFDIHDVWGNPPAADKIVDTTYIRDGRKIIEFRSLHPKFQERTTFIEGVGSNWGIIYKQYYGLVQAHYLLCYYKNGEKIFANKYYNGECNIHLTTATPEPEKENAVLVYPNPASVNLFIREQGPHSYAIIRILNMHGQLMRQRQYSNVVDIAALPAGLYILQLVTRIGKVQAGKLVIK